MLMPGSLEMKTVCFIRVFKYQRIICRDKKYAKFGYTIQTLHIHRNKQPRGKDPRVSKKLNRYVYCHSRLSGILLRKNSPLIKGAEGVVQFSANL